jgi:hypothetical protein
MQVVLSDEDLLSEFFPDADVPVYREPPVFVSSRRDSGGGGFDRSSRGDREPQGDRGPRGERGSRDAFKPRQDFGPTGHDYARCADDGSGDLASAGGVDKV